MKDELRSLIEAGNFKDALPALLTATLAEAVAGVKEAGYEIEGETRAAEFDPEALCSLIVSLAESGTVLLADLKDQAPDRLEASVYVFQTLARIVAGALKRRVPTDIDGLADYRAQMIIAGWMGGIMYGGLLGARSDLYRKAAMYDGHRRTVEDGLKKGNNAIRLRVDAWEAKAKRTAQAALDANADISLADLRHAIRVADPRAPKSDALDKKLRLWLRDRTLEPGKMHKPGKRPQTRITVAGSNTRPE